ncbi:MAG: DNA gyrase subunit A [Bacilli bacterium]|jgi:DNA gyrase subunit A
MDNEEKKNDVATEATDENNSDVAAGIVPALRDTEIVSEVQNSFLDYAMSVIVSRALPDVRDGLKPVHRRVIFGMATNGYTPDKPFVKSAKVVGDVMGSYHPHGDSAIYGTLVRLAQPFSMRYTMVTGHGNFGSMDGDEAAAMRYTECKLSKLALEMTRGMDEDTVDFVPNYDGTLKEPVCLPSRFPNLLCNGSDGIAVGMATKMPPHNLCEVVDAIVAISKNHDLTTEQLMQIVKGPDFPTGGIIYGLGGIKDAYENGRGTFRLRGRATIEEKENEKSKIIITEIPYQVNKAALVEKIGELVRNKIIDGITGIRDLSKEDVNIEIDCRRDAVPQVILNQLYKNTQLEVSYGVINLCIVNGAPKILSLKSLLENYLTFQIEVIDRRTKFLLKKAQDRLNIVEALLVVHDNIDEVVDHAKTCSNPQEFSDWLKKRFEFSDEQAKAIVAMTLGRLTGIETTKLLDEKKSLNDEIKNDNFILSSKENETAVVIKELLEIKDKFGDKRKTEISHSIVSVEDEDLIPEQDIVITLTEKGYIKRMSLDEFRTQNRGGMGVKGMTVYSDDEVATMVTSKTHTDILFFSSLGRVYRKRGHEINEASRQSKGIPVLNLLNLDNNETINSIISVDTYKDKFLFFATKKGVVKRTSLEEFERINCNGKYAITLKEDDSLLGVKVTDGNAKIILASDKGKACVFNEKDVRAMGRTAAGVRGMRLPAGGNLVAVATSLEGLKSFVLSENGLGKLSELEDYRLTKRGAGGVITLKVTDKTGSLVGLKMVNGDEDVIVITNNGQVMRTTLEQVRVIGRNSQGVKIINLKDKEKVSSFTIAPKAEEEASVPEENINEASMPHDDLSDEDASTTDETSDETKDV